MSRKLTKDLIRSRLGNDDFESIKNLNLWGNNIDDITLLSEMPFLEIISLSVNHIKDLSVFSKLKNLKELYLKDNQISDFNQIEHLKNCPKLDILCLTDNPICKQSNYRQKILEILPHLKKLDDIDITTNNNSATCNNSGSGQVTSFPKSSFILFKKIFPKRANKFKTNMNIKELNTSDNEQINNNNNNNNANDNKNNNEIISKNEAKNDLLNKSFQKKRTIGTFRIKGNKKSINLDLSVEYDKVNIFGNNNEIIDQNKSFVADYKTNNIDMNTVRSKYNKKVVGNFKKDQIKNYQSTLLKYQEFDTPVKKEENKKNINDNNKNNIINSGNSGNIIKSNKNEKNESVILQSIRILLDTLNLAELKLVNDDIQKIMKEKK